ARRSSAGCIPVREMEYEELQQYASAGAPPALQQRLTQMWPLARANVPYGRPTRGWRVVYPTRGTERHELRRQCGDKCFLAPEQEGFPICTKLEVQARNPTYQCLPMRQGEQAAFNRARQTRHEQVAELAEEMLESTCP